MFFFNKRKNKAKIFKDLEFLGYDPIKIREVLHDHNDFESALKVLSEDKENDLQEGLIKFEIPNKAAKILSNQFQDLDQALNYYYEYESNIESIKKILSELGYHPRFIEMSINNLWTVDRAVYECGKNPRRFGSIYVNENAEERKVQRNLSNANTVFVI